MTTEQPFFLFYLAVHHDHHHGTSNLNRRFRTLMSCLAQHVPPHEAEVYAALVLYNEGVRAYVNEEGNISFKDPCPCSYTAAAA